MLYADRVPASLGGAQVDHDELQDTSSRPTKLFLGGITRNTTTKQLRDHFSQYGRVLDCIAMRQLDGRPRGFGYVTLDSPEAAMRCVMEPQIIDGRVIDVKQAIPEGGAGGRDAHFMQAQDSWQQGSHAVNQCLPPWCLAAHGMDCPREHVGGPTWPLMYGHQEQPLDSVEMLFAQRAAAAASENEAMMVESAASRWLSGSMSANAPEFVPRAAPMHSRTAQKEGGGLYRQPSSAPQLVQEEELVARQASREAVQKPRAPLGEITNVHSSMAPMPEAKLGDALRGAMAAECAGAVNCPLPLILPSSEKLGGLDLAGAQEDSSMPDTHSGDLSRAGSFSASASGSCGEGVEENDHREEEDDDDDEDEDDWESDADHSQQPPAVLATQGKAPSDSELPSVGSALHALGQCKRCNFFSKGRCLNGSECSFCHLPHEKRKPSRQEKRARKATWLAHQQLDTKEDSEELNGNAFQQVLSALSSGPTSLISDSMIKAMEMQGPALPPGLPLPAKRPGLSFWQPDEEASTAPGLSPMDETTALFLSTTPLAGSVRSVTTTASTPRSRADSEVLSGLGMPSSAPIAACTIATQTEADWMCAVCAAGKA